MVSQSWTRSIINCSNPRALLGENIAQQMSDSTRLTNLMVNNDHLKVNGLARLVDSNYNSDKIYVANFSTSMYNVSALVQDRINKEKSHITRETL